jgi:hypothetical protein
MTAWRPALLLAIAALPLECAEPPQELVEVSFQVRDDEGRPVAGASILVDGAPMTTTDRRGEARCRLPVRTSPPYRLAHVCPKEFRAVEPEAKLRADPLRPLARTAGGGAALSVCRHCVPLRRRHVLLVRTGGRAGLPIRVLGRTAGMTDADGDALLTLDGAPGDEVEISIDTSAAPRLRPVSPSRRLELPDARRFFVFDQRFEERRPAHGKRGRPTRIPKRL